jgi:hypothetical protein
MGPAGFVLFCDCASNYIPAELYGLGLRGSELGGTSTGHRRSGRSEALSEIFGCPGDTLRN